MENKNLSVDFGGSTIDIAHWRNGSLERIESYEKHSGSGKDGLDFLRKKVDVGKFGKVFITGGKSRLFKLGSGDLNIRKIPEIEAIGRGGAYLAAHDGRLNGFKGLERFLVVSMGTGTCMVEVNQGKSNFVKSRHVGGTGVGGGTFLGLAKLLIGETDIKKLLRMFGKGNKDRVDLSVKDIVGSGIGIISAGATASNLAKISRDVDFNKNDLAAGIVNLIGQTVGVTATFAARANNLKWVLLTGKLTRIKPITQIITETGAVYGIKMMVLKNADYIAALGAGYR